jgi:hypothetical protein
MIINRTHGGNASGNILRIAIGISVLASLLLVNSGGASTGLEAISVNPTQGPSGSVVAVSGTGWYEHASVGWDVRLFGLALLMTWVVVILTPVAISV